MLAYPSVIDVLTESHRSGGGIRTARHRLAPPAMLTDESWAAGERQKKRKKKTLSASLWELVFMNSCCSFFFQHSDCQFISCVCCCCDHNAYFCVVVEIVVMIFEPAPPLLLPPSDFVVCFWLNLEKCCAESFCFTQLWIFTDLCEFLVMYVRVRACVWLCSAVVDV